MYDIHCHVLPGVDDGPGDVKTAMSMIDVAYKQGIRHIVCTSHMNHPMKFNEQGIDEAYKTMEELVKDKYPDVSLYEGREVYISRGLINNVEEIPVKTIGDSNYILVEFSRDILLEDIDSSTHELKLLGYRPIVAHPEMYYCLDNQCEHMAEMVGDGILFQCNAGSIHGEHETFTRSCIEKGLIDFIGSDAHGTKVRPHYMDQAYEWVSKTLGSVEANRIFIDNPCAILDNRKVIRAEKKTKKKGRKIGLEVALSIVAIGFFTSMVYGARDRMLESDSVSEVVYGVEDVEEEADAIDEEKIQAEVNMELLESLRETASEIQKTEGSVQDDSSESEETIESVQEVEIVVTSTEEKDTVEVEAATDTEIIESSSSETTESPSTEDTNLSTTESGSIEVSREEFLINSYVSYMEELRSLYMTIVDDYYLQLKAAVHIEDEEEREAKGEAIRAELGDMEVEVDNEVNKVLYDMQNDLEDIDADVSIVQELRDDYFETKADVSGKYKAELEAYYNENH